MKCVNLDTLVWFQEGPGVRNYQYVDKGIKLINVTNLVNGRLKLHLTSRYISKEEAFGKYKHFLCDNGDLVIASSGITYETLSKKIAFVTENDLPLCMNTSVIRFKPINRDVCIDYIYYFFKSEKYRNQISKLMTGSAQLNYGPSHLHKVEIPYYDIVKQTKIADELKKIDENISICYRNIDNLDNIVKSQFIEMFGDPISNEKRWEVKELNEVTDVRDGTHDSPKYYDSGYPFVTSKNLINGGIDFSTCQLICEDDYLHFNDRSRVDDGDILMPMIGTIGGAIIVNKDRDFAIKNVALIKFNKNNKIVNRTFVHNILNSDSMNEYFNHVKKGGTQNFISLGISFFISNKYKLYIFLYLS